MAKRAKRAVTVRSRAVNCDMLIEQLSAFLDRKSTRLNSSHT